MADTTSRAGASYATPELLDWLHRTHTAHDARLQRAFDAPSTTGMPAIQVGPAEGKMLQLFARMIGAKKIVEVGTLAGYSAIHLARGLAPGGRVWTIEFDAKHAKVARETIAAAQVADLVTVLEGKGVDVLPTLEAQGPFDLVFVDADKQSYDEYGRWAAKNVRKGGLLLGDNAYFFGKLIDPNDATAAAMRRFHEEARTAFDTVCVPTPDGLLLGIKR